MFVETRIPINLSSAGDNTVISANADANITIKAGELFANAAVVIVLKDGSTAINGDGYQLPSQSGYTIINRMKLSKGNAFIINLSAAVSVTGWIEYIQR